MYQHDFVRKHKVCVCCGKPKAEGLLLCWPCHHKEKQRCDGDYSQLVKNAIAIADAELRGSV